MIKISAVIITFNEENNIGRCLKSLEGIVDEIVVVDSLSTDKTAEICSGNYVRFFQQKFLGYRDQKNFALSKASYRYILSLDADEALSEELKNSILKVKENWKFDAYKFNRLANYCGKWIYYSNWYPGKIVRLFDSTKGQWGGFNVHETVKMQKGCRTGYLKGDLLHWTYNSIEDHLQKAIRYSGIGAQEYFNTGRKAGPFTASLHYFWRFFKSYFLKLGFLDGYYGFVICSVDSYSCFMKYIYLRRLILHKKQKINIPE